MTNQKDLPYYPGCSSAATSLEYDMSTRAVLKALGLNPVEVPDWSCCGSTPAHTVNHVLSAALSARNLALIAGMGHSTVTTPCPSCLMNLKSAAHKTRDKNFREKTNRLMDVPYDGDVAVKSVLQSIWEDVGYDGVKGMVRKGLKGIRLACYYGCLMNRPPELIEFDNPEHPVVMDRIMEAAGAEVVPFPLKVECCGASFGITRKDIVARLSGKLLAAAAQLDVDALVTACPLCQMNLDLRQSQVNSANGTDYRIPVFYYTQLLGIAFDFPSSVLGLDRLVVSPAPVLAKLKGNPADKNEDRGSGQ
jgi:heterodisulfide reductase subunit B2